MAVQMCAAISQHSEASSCNSCKARICTPTSFGEITNWPSLRLGVASAVDPFALCSQGVHTIVEQVRSFPCGQLAVDQGATSHPTYGQTDSRVCSVGILMGRRVQNRPNYQARLWPANCQGDRVLPRCILPAEVALRTFAGCLPLDIHAVTLIRVVAPDAPLFG